MVSENIAPLTCHHKTKFPTIKPTIYLPKWKFWIQLSLNLLHESECFRDEVLFNWNIPYTVEYYPLLHTNGTSILGTKIGGKNGIRVYKPHPKIAILKSGKSNKKYRNLVIILLKIASWKAGEITRNAHTLSEYEFGKRILLTASKSKKRKAGLNDNTWQSLYNAMFGIQRTWLCYK